MTRTVTPTFTITVTSTPCTAGAWKSKTNSGVIFQYRVVDCGQNIECILSATGTGWLAVGWHTNTASGNGKGNSANIIIGNVAGGTATIQDQYNSSGNSHPSDTSGGGVDNIINPSGTEIGGVTELRFKYPLNSGTSRDIPLVAGSNYNWLFARHSTNDSLTVQHTTMGVIQNSPF
jgi:hypothetical protein